jgi:Papain family cysteine protease
MDYADPKKDDRFKPFAARASAEVLFKFFDKVALPWITAYVEERRAISQLAAKRLADEDLANEVELAVDQLRALARADIQSLGDLASLASGFPSFIRSVAGDSVLTTKVEDRLRTALNMMISTTRDSIVASRFDAVSYKGTRWRVGAEADQRGDTRYPPLNRALGAIDLRIPSWSVRDQGSHGNSVAFACTAAAEHGWYTMSSSTRDFSAQFLHWRIKSRDGNEHQGATLESASRVLLRDGICEERTWPYESLSEPSLFARRQALHHRFLPNYMHASDNNAQIVLDILRRGKVAVISVPVFSDPMVSDGPTNWTTAVGWVYGRVFNPPPRSVVVGGHAVCVVGFAPDETEDAGGYFIFRNSWGTSWASAAPSQQNSHSFEAGYGEISASYINDYLWELLYL